MSPGRIAVVTGANKGIGLAIVRNLALQYPASLLRSGPLLVYLTARDRQRGQDALRAMQNDSQLAKAQALEAQGGLTSLKFHPLDISQTKSIQDFRDFLKTSHPDGIDIIVNNAGVALTGFNEDVVKKTLEVNYYGTLEACEELLPLLRPHGRLVNVSSASGSLGKYSKHVQEAFRSATTIGQVTKLMKDFRVAVQDHQEIARGWPKAAYAVSKSGCTALTRALAHAEEQRTSTDGRLINACCPGLVDTDMAVRTVGNKLTPDQGAATPMLLALGDLKGQSGLYWKNERPANW